MKDGNYPQRMMAKHSIRAGYKFSKAISLSSGTVPFALLAVEASIFNAFLNQFDIENKPANKEIKYHND